MRASYVFPLAAVLISIVSSRLLAEEDFPESVVVTSKVDMVGFLSATVEVAEYRRSRLVDIDGFLEMASDPRTLILDTRSKDAYQRKHLAGAVHLNFSDFDAEKLARVIPAKSTRVLIYCNNNLGGDKQNFFSKKPAMALNIPTFVNLYGYGYRNVYELGTFVSVEDRRLKFAGTDVTPPNLAAK